MKISTNTGYINHSKQYTGSELIAIHAKAGFTVLDHTPHISNESWQEEVRRTKEVADKYGILIEQTHAPYNRYTRKPLDEYRADMDRFIEATHMLGAQRMVIHADDFGIGGGQTDAMKALGKYITCTHVHDNDKRADKHLIPFLSTTDWDAEMRAMKSFGYKGNLTFEMVYGDIPDALHVDFLTYLLKLGEYMRSVFDRA